MMASSGHLRRGDTPPTNLHEYQNKGVVKFAFHKCMKKKSLDGSYQEGDEFQNGKSGRIPSVAMKGVRKQIERKKDNADFPL